MSGLSQDIEPPVFQIVPGDVIVECVGDVPVMTSLGWIDNVDGSGTVTGSDVSDGLTCPETITRTWTYTDQAGNGAMTSQTITVEDTQAPVFASAPGDITVECVGDVPAMTDLGWTDNCDGSGTVSGTDGALTGGTCGGTITRTWTYTDACGNTGTETQIITVNDTQAPTASNPDTVYLSSGDPMPAPDVNVITDEADNCGSVTVEFVSSVSDGQQTCETITHTYSVSDICGNSTLVEQIITYCNLLGISENELASITPWPNPTKGVVNFGVNLHEYNLVVSTLNGTIVDQLPSGELNSNEYLISAQPGTYIISLTPENGETPHFFRIIKTE